MLSLRSGLNIYQNEKRDSINFYVPSSSYGAVEITHLAICHAIVDILYKK